MKQSGNTGKSQSKPAVQNAGNNNKPRPEIRDDLDSRERKEGNLVERNDHNSHKDKPSKK